MSLSGKTIVKTSVSKQEATGVGSISDVTSMTETVQYDTLDTELMYKTTNTFSASATASYPLDGTLTTAIGEDFDPNELYYIYLKNTSTAECTITITENYSGITSARYLATLSAGEFVVLSYSDGLDVDLTDYEIELTASTTGTDVTCTMIVFGGTLVPTPTPTPTP